MNETMHVVHRDDNPDDYGEWLVLCGAHHEALWAMYKLTTGEWNQSDRSPTCTACLLLAMAEPHLVKVRDG
jgi:hypothetical protein